MHPKRFSKQFWAGRVLSLAIWFVIYCGPLPVFAIDLARVVRLTKAQSFEIKRLKEKARSSDRRIKEKQGGFTPSIGISMYHLQTDQSKPIDIFKKNSDYEITLSQPLYKPGLWHDYQEAVLNARILDIQLREMNENLAFETLLTVIEICRIRSRLTITENSRVLVVQTVEIQKQLLQSGYGSRFDLNEAEVELARYEKEVLELDNQLYLKLFELRNMSGTMWNKKEFPIIVDPKINSFQKLPLSTVSDWVEIAYQNNSQLQLIQINQELNQISKARGYNNLKPRVDLTLTYHQAEEEAITRNRVDDCSIKLSMAMNFSPVSNYYQIQRFDIEENVLNIEADKVKKNLEDSISQLLKSIQLKYGLTKAQRRWKFKQKITVDLFRKGLKQKHFPFSRFLDSSRKYNESQHDLAQMFIDIWENRIRLLHLSGQLKAEILHQLALEFNRISESTG